MLSEKKGLGSLLEVGHYITSAIGCFVSEWPRVPLKINVPQITNKISELTDEFKRGKYFRPPPQSLTNKRYSREFNFTIFDLSVFICKFKKSSRATCLTGDAFKDEKTRGG